MDRLRVPADCSIMTPANRPSINSCRLRQRIQLCFDSFYAYYNGIPTGTQAICAHIILFMHIFVCLIMHYHTFSIIKLLFSQYVPKPVCRFLRNPLSCFYIQLQQTVSVFKRIDGGHIINIGPDEIPMTVTACFPCFQRIPPSTSYCYARY